MIFMNSKQKIFCISLLIVLLLGLSAVSAINDTQVKKTNPQKVAKSTDNSMHSKLIKNNNTPVSKKVKKESVETSNKEKVTKTEKKKVKTSTNMDVNNYQELYDTLTTSQEENLTISLKGDKAYKISDAIVLKDSIKNLTLNGNDKTIDGDRKHSFLRINHKVNLYLNNMTIQNCLLSGDGGEDLYGGVLNASKSNITIKNVNFIENGIYEEVSQEKYPDYGQYNRRDVNGGVLSLHKCNLMIFDSTFDSNYAQTYINESSWFYRDGGVIYSSNSNITINNSVFTSNRGSQGGVINTEGYPWNDDEYDYDNEYYLELNINNSLFKSNMGDSGCAISITEVNSTITHTDFINNTLNIGIDGSRGNAGAIYIYDDSVVKLNHTNFISNGLYVNYKGHCEAGAILCMGTLEIDYSNFTDNQGECGGAILCEGGGLTINHTQIKENVVNDNYFVGIVTAECEYAVIDYCTFISNRYKLFYSSDYEEFSGSILTYGSCNVTNSIFKCNDGPNFVVSDQKIMLNRTNGFVPENANVSVYVDESTEYENYTLAPIDGSYKSYLIGLNVEPENYVFKLVVTQTQESPDDYLYNEFYNNTFYVIIHQDIKLNASSTNITVGNKSKINGRLYFENGDTVVGLKNKEILLYINGTLQDKTVTDDNGDYIFHYQGNTVGVQDARVVFNGTFFLDAASNNTQFMVEQIPTSMKLDVQDEVNLGDNLIIKGKVEDIYSKAVSNSIITVYIGNDKTTAKTDANGEFKITYKTKIAGENNIFAIYDGNYTYIKSSDTNTFNVKKLKSMITVTATNTSYNQKSTITGKLLDQNSKAITKGTVTLHVNNDSFEVTTDKNGEFKLNYKAKLLGENHVTVFFENNENYIDCSNKTSFTVTKTNTKISVKSTNTTEGKNTTITGKLKDMNNNLIKNAEVNIYWDAKKIASVKTDKNGRYSYSYTATKNGKYNITASFAGNEYYNPSKAVTQIKVKATVKTRTKIKVKSITAKDSSKVTLKATVKDIKGNLLNNGKVVFKINFKTVKDKKGNVCYVNVKNGVAKLTITPSSGLWNKNSDLNAVYMGTDKYNSSKSNTAKLLLVPGNATIKFTDKLIKAKSYDTVTFKTQVKDVDGSTINTGNVTFKINSMTLGVAKVKNGFATFEYKLNGKTAETYKITAVYSSNMYKRVQKTIDLVVSRAPTRIIVKHVKSSKKTFTLKAKIVDKNNKAINKATKVSVKINEKTYVKEVKVSNGNINLKVPTRLAKGSYKLTIISGANGYYKESVAKTNLTLTS